MSDLTARQKLVYDYIASRIRGGLPPTYREIGREFGIRSPNGVQAHIRALERKGYIERVPRTSRALKVVRGRLPQGEITGKVVCLGDRIEVVSRRGDREIRTIFSNEVSAAQQITALHQMILEKE